MIGTKWIDLHAFFNFCLLFVLKCNNEVFENNLVLLTLSYHYQSMQTNTHKLVGHIELIKILNSHLPFVLQKREL